MEAFQKLILYSAIIILIINTIKVIVIVCFTVDINFTCKLILRIWMCVVFFIMK